MQPEEIIEARVEGLNEYGEGFFTYKNHVIKVGRTVRGDRVRVRLPALSKHFVRGQVLEVLEASELRVPAGLCPDFEQGCGGCQWLHVSYAEQLQAKAGIVASLLSRQAGLKVAVLPVLGMAEPQAYRNKMSLINIDGRLAFKKEYSDAAIYPQTCRQETRDNQAVWAALRGLDIPPEVLQLHLRSAGGRVGILLFARNSSPQLESLALRISKLHPLISGIGAASYRDYRLLWGRDDLIQELGGIHYGIALNGFFQTNYSQALILRDLVMAQMQVQPADKVLDLFCGSGFFSLAIAKQCAMVLGIENNRDSIRSAVANARRNSLGNCRFVSADAAKALRDIQVGVHRLILLDPPRSGCGPELLAELLRLQPERMVYVSCSPESLAADLAVLVKTSYSVSYCQPVDMFPHTFHVETIVSLTRHSARDIGRKN